MKQPIRILRSPLTGRIYAVTKYVEQGNGNFISKEKQDVTEDVLGICAALKEEDKE